MYLYFLSKQNIGLSVAEILSLSKKKSFELINHYLLLDELVDYKRLAYTKKVYEVLFVSNHEFFIEDFSNFDFERKFKDSFKLSAVSNKSFDLKILADIIWKSLKKPKVDVKNPGTFFEIIFSDKKIFFCVLLEKSRDCFESRKAHLRPFNHPTSLHPRLARCMVNLANSKEILDPFCGSGGILIEAGLTGCKATGYDFDSLMLKRARANIDYFKVKNYYLIQKNALNIDKQFEAVVTDLPYGKNSKAGDLNELYSKFLKLYLFFTDKMVISFPDFTDNEKIIFSSGWMIKEKFTYYMHKSLSKELFVLFKDV